MSFIHRASNSHRRRLTGGDYNDLVLGTGPIALWMQDENAGGVARCSVNPAQNGTYVGVTLANDNTGPFGTPAPYWDGANDSNNVFTPAFAAAFDINQGTILIWAKREAPPGWQPINTAYLFQPHFVNSSNVIGIAKLNATPKWVYQQGANIVSHLQAEASADWICWALSWSIALDEFRPYRNGAQQVATKNGLIAPVGAMTLACIGATSPAPAAVWQGWIGHVAVWDRALPPATIASLYVS